MANKYEKIHWILFCIALLPLSCDFIVEKRGWLAISCLWLLLLYLMWYDVYASKKKFAIIPIWLYIIGYYIIYWDSMLDVFRFFWDILFG